jgi:hypothetical protein
VERRGSGDDIPTQAGGAALTPPQIMGNARKGENNA